LFERSFQQFNNYFLAKYNLYKAIFYRFLLFRSAWLLHAEREIYQPHTLFLPLNAFPENPFWHQICRLHTASVRTARWQGSNENTSQQNRIS